MRTWFIRIIELALQRGRDRHLLLWPSCNFPARSQARRSREPASPSKLAESAARRNIIERVKIDLEEDEIRRLIDGVDYYEAYLHSQQRDEKKFRELLLRPACGKESRSRERNSVQIAMHRGIDVSKM